MAERGTPVASVIIPAYNEERNIGRCLAALQPSMHTLGLEVVVAANGCSDRTVAVAQEYPGVRVLDLAEPSKVAALNAADALASAFPRLYLDADVVLDEAAVRSLVRLLSTEQVRLAAPAVRFETRESDAVVRAFYRAFERMPATTGAVVGRGVYGLSRAARARFGVFPDLVGDDLFVTRLFSAEETVVADGTSTVWPPRTWRDLVKVRTRVARGNSELASARTATTHGPAGGHDFSPTTGRSLAAIGRLALTQPSLWPGVAAYAAVTLTARTRAVRTEPRSWQRDASTR